MRKPKGRWWSAGVAAVACAAMSVVSWGAPAQLTSNSFTETVSVGRVGGPTVKGEIAACTPELLTIQPPAKPKAKSAKGDAADPPKPDPVQIAWQDVRHVSNGLTARSALYAWEAAHPTQLCPDCRGERNVQCPTCKGTNHDPAAAANCKTCHGELLVACKTRGEDGGAVACPNNCLQAGVGHWVKDDKGVLWRWWQLGGGRSQSFSEHHVGDVIVIDLPGHVATDAGRCPICGGTSKVLDAVCHGTGKVPCPECLTRKAAACPNGCDGGRVVCPTCKGTGLVVTAKG